MTARDSLSDLAGLALLTRLQRDRDEAETARLAAEASHLRDRIAALDALAQRAFETGPEALSRQVMGTDALWHSRIGLDRQRLMAELARLRARQEVQADRHRQSFGRDEAIAALTAEAQTLARRDTQRRLQDRLDALLCTPGRSG